MAREDEWARDSAASFPALTPVTALTTVTSTSQTQPATSVNVIVTATTITATPSQVNENPPLPPVTSTPFKRKEIESTPSPNTSNPSRRGHSKKEKRRG